MNLRENYTKDPLFQRSGLECWGFFANMERQKNILYSLDNDNGGKIQRNSQITLNYSKTDITIAWRYKEGQAYKSVIKKEK